MRRSKKILHDILCCATALSLCATLPAVTYAESSVAAGQTALDEESEFVFSVYILDPAAVYPTSKDVVYPSAPSASDLSVTLTTAGGEKITESCAITSTGRVAIFKLDSKKDISKYTLTLNTDESRMSFGTGFDYAMYDTGTKQLCTTVSGTYDSTDEVYGFAYKRVNGELVVDYERGEVVQENERSTTLMATLSYTGLNSVTLCYNEHEELDTPNAVGRGIYDVREEYGVTNVVSAKVYADGEYYCDAVPGGKGIFYYVTPVEWSDEEAAFICPDDVQLTMTIEAFNSRGYLYTVDVPLATWRVTPMSAETFGTWLNQYNIVLDAYDEDSEDAPDIKKPFEPEADEEEEIGISLPDANVYANQLSLNINSTLSQFRKELLYTDISEQVTLMGLPTPTYKAQFMGMSFADSVPVAWDTVAFANEKSVGLDAGTYTLAADTRIELLSDNKPISEIKVTDKGTKKYNLTATPRYTLTLDSLLQGDFKFTVDGQELSGSGTEYFVLEPNTNYMLTDAATGKQYSVLATDATPHLKVTLGSDQGSVGTVNPSDDFEDVPNTADSMTILFAILGGIVAALAAAAGIVFFKMKRSK